MAFFLIFRHANGRLNDSAEQFLLYQSSVRELAFLSTPLFHSSPSRAPRKRARYLTGIRKSDGPSMTKNRTIMSDKAVHVPFQICDRHRIYQKMFQNINLLLLAMQSYIGGQVSLCKMWDIYISLCRLYHPLCKYLCWMYIAVHSGSSTWRPHQSITVYDSSTTHHAQIIVRKN